MVNYFSTAFQVYLPGNLGKLSNVSVHGLLSNIEIVRCYQYISFCGLEWSKVFHRNDGREVTYCYSQEDVESYAISFPIKIRDFMEGRFFLTFTAVKDGNSTFYYTENHYFRKADKLICVRQSYKRGF